MDRRERQLHLRLDASYLGDAEPRRLARGVAQQRGLSDARFAADHENGAPTASGLSQHGVEALALVCSAEKPQPPDWRHLATLEDSLLWGSGDCPLPPRLEKREQPFRWRPADRAAALTELPGNLRRNRFSRGGADDRATLADVAHRAPVEERCPLGRRVSDDVDATERRNRLGEQALDIEL